MLLENRPPGSETNIRLEDVGHEEEKSSGCTATGSSQTQDINQESESGHTSAVTDTMTRLLKGKEKEWAAVVERKGSLKLLDLPVDVLKEIMKEVTHTNDLTSLALTHSALHHLAIPYIYSRFDIVWPDAQNTSEPRTGVDALTFGLATLVMSHEVFGESAHPCRHESQLLTCSHCGELNEVVRQSRDSKRLLRKNRRGNYFAQYTRKFSLGNGPSDWVQEYLINKEGGKMLGTLVALAIARMPNLETFVWDMPTGVLRDVWFALSSLGDRWDGEDPRLEKLWIRYHDNKSVAPSATVQQPVDLSPSVPQPPTNTVSFDHSGHSESTNDALPLTLLEKSYRNIEYPSFSILPPLKSLTALDIDEPAYLEEMSVLIERSVSRLRELRIGTASIWYAKSWSSPTQSTTTQATDADSSMDFAASGGMLGMIMSKLYDCRMQTSVLSQTVRESEAPVKAVNSIPDGHITTELDSKTHISNMVPLAGSLAATLTNVEADVGNLMDIQSASSEIFAYTTGALFEDARNVASQILDSTVPDIQSPTIMATSNPYAPQLPMRASAPLGMLPLRPTASEAEPLRREESQDSKKAIADDQNLPNVMTDVPLPPLPKQRKLRLETLELERVPMSVHVLQKTIDWTILTSLTLLNCESDDELWKALRRTYTPKPRPLLIPIASQLVVKRTSQQYLNNSSSDRPLISASEYRLKLRRIHTNAVSSALISFLKETLAPDSLEWMFLQDRGQSASKVTIDTIYRGPLRRHRGSLKKVMVDSGDRRSSESNSRSQKWKKWMFNREVLTFVTSGKMSCLRELAMSVDYKDWHFFLQRLPQIPRLRSLYVSHIADHVYGHHLDARELALQVVDIVALRPEIELCYMGISSKCFEILENRHLDDPTYTNHDSTTSPANAGPGGVVIGDQDDDSDADDDDNDNEGDDEDAAATAPVGDADDNDSDMAEDSDTNSDDDSLESEDGRKRPRLKLREILFYDDKVSIFKARHGQL